MRLGPELYSELDERLAVADAELRRYYPGPRPGRQPVHTVYVPADRFGADLVASWGAAARAALVAHPPLPFAEDLHERVLAKLAREPIEDVRIDFEDGYGVRDDADEDAAARAAGAALAAGPMPPFAGLRCKSLEAGTRRRAIRTLDVFLDALGRTPEGFVVTLPKVSRVEQVDAMVHLCARLEQAYGLHDGGLRFELQVETTPAVLGADGTATVARMVHAAGDRCVGLHYGTYDYSAECGIAPAYQSLDHAVADHAKAVMQVAAAGTGVRVCDGSTNVLPVGETAQVQAAWRRHAALVRRSLERGFYQGWDLHPAQLPTRFGATYAFFREGLAEAVARLAAYRPGGSGSGAGGSGGGVLDEPATVRALTGFLRRGVECGALDPAEVPGGV